MDGYGKRVLIVGDNEDSRQVLSHLFAQTDYNIHLATDGLHALNEMTKRHFDAVILDYCMPSMEEGSSCSRARRPGPRHRSSCCPVTPATSNTT